MAMAQQVVSEGLCVTHYVFALYDEAALDRPITIGLEPAVEPGTQEALDLISFDKFGTEVSIPAAIDIRMPGGLGGKFQAGRVLMSALPSDEARPYSIRLQLVDPGGAEKALVTLNMEPVTQGPSRAGTRAYGTEAHGTFDLELKHDREASNLQMNLKLHELTGKPAVSVLEGLRFVQEFHSPNHLRVAQPYGPITSQGDPLPEEGSLIEARFEFLAVEALASLQGFTSQQIMVPDLSATSGEDVADWRQVTRIVAGETVIVTWDKWAVTLPGDKVELLDHEHGFRLCFSLPLEATVGAQVLDFGLKQVYIVSAKVSSEEATTPVTEGVRVPLVPAAFSNEAHFSLVQPGAAAGDDGSFPPPPPAASGTS